MSAANANKLLLRDDLFCTTQYCGLFFFMISMIKE